MPIRQSGITLDNSGQIAASAASLTRQRAIRDDSAIQRAAGGPPGHCAFRVPHRSRCVRAGSQPISLTVARRIPHRCLRLRAPRDSRFRFRAVSGNPAPCFRFHCRVWCSSDASSGCLGRRKAGWQRFDDLYWLVDGRQIGMGLVANTSILSAGERDVAVEYRGPVPARQSIRLVAKRNHDAPIADEWSEWDPVLGPFSK